MQPSCAHCLLFYPDSGLRKHSKPRLKETAAQPEKPQLENGCTLTEGIDVPLCCTLFTLSWLKTEATILRSRADPMVSEAELSEASGGSGLLAFMWFRLLTFFNVICYWDYPVPSDFIFTYEICKDPFSK